MAEGLPLVKPVIVRNLGSRKLNSSWAFELKHDGLRGLLHVNGSQAYFMSKSGKIMRRFAEFAGLLGNVLAQDSLILDGEIAAFDPFTGKSYFREILRHSAIPTYAAFDLLYHNGQDLRNLPWVKRKQLLKKLLHDKVSILCVDWENNPFRIGRLAQQHKLEGLVAKRKEDPYTPLTEWFKIKNQNYNHLEVMPKAMNVKKTRGR